LDELPPVNGDIMILKNIDSIGAEDISELVNVGVKENAKLDYKSEIRLESDRDKKEWLTDLCSFANSDGGDILVGISEKRINGKNTGEPGEIVGVIGNIDQICLTVQQLNRTKIDPPIPGLKIKAVEVDGKKVLLFRVPKSNDAPHWATYGPSNYFHRNNNGKEEMNTSQLKKIVLQNVGGLRDIRSFVGERISLIKENSSYFPTGYEVLAGHIEPVKTDFPVIVVHLIPMDALNSRDFLEMHIVEEKAALLAPIWYSSTYGRYNFDGYYVCCSRRGSPEVEKVEAYTQIFRNGIIEATCAMPLQRIDGVNSIPGESFKGYFASAVKRYLELQRALGLETSIFVVLSLLRVKGKNIAFNFDIGNFKNCQDQMTFPELTIDSSAEKQDSFKLLKPILDTVAQTVGMKEWPN
jgi:hypothetical protein